MKRVTQFDMYLLGLVRSLSYLKRGDRPAACPDKIVMCYVTIDSFCKDELAQRLLPEAIVEAKHLRTVAGLLDDAIGEKSSLVNSSGEVTEDAQEIVSRAVASFETALKHGLQALPTYIIEKIGIYDTDDLLTKADAAIATGLKSYIPTRAVEDFKKAGACLTFELYTASGFHGYRAVDETLRAYCVHFTGSLPQRRDWGQFLQAVRNVPLASTRNPNTRTIELIDRVRAEDRNPLIHPDTDLSATEAHLAFDLCRSAIVFMAMDIKNAP